MTRNWQEVVVADLAAKSSNALATGPFGSAISSKFFEPIGVPVIRGSNLTDTLNPRLIDENLVFVSPAKASEFTRSIVRRGDLIFTCWGTVGQVGLIDKRAHYAEYVISNKQMKLTPNPQVADSLFLYYVFSSPPVSEAIKSQAIGSSVPGFNLGQLKATRLRIPPLKDQRGIAGILGALDDKIEQNRQTAQALERLAQAIFRAWFVDFEPVMAKAAGATAFPSMPQPIFDALPTSFVESDIGLVPEGWEVKALSSICTLVGGGTPKRSEATYWDGDVPWYSVKDAPGPGELWVVRTSERISVDGLADSAARIVPKGSTIISARGTVGKLAMAGVPMAFNQSCYGLLPGDGKSFGYLHLLMQSVVADLQQRVHGSVFDTITRLTFDGLLVTSPRGEVVSAFESVVGPLLALPLASVNESAKLAAIRDYLLPKLLGGDLQVEATDG